MCVLVHAICGVDIKGWGDYEVEYVIISYYQSIKSVKHQSHGCCMWCDPKSYNRSYVHYCVPWTLEKLSNDPGTGTTNDFDCCLH